MILSDFFQFGDHFFPGYLEKNMNLQVFKAYYVLHNTKYVQNLHF